MRLPRVRFTVRRLMFVVPCLAAFLAFIATPVYQEMRYWNIRQELNDRISSLKPAVPPGTNPTVWDCASSWTITAYGNVCFSEEHVSLEEMYCFRDDLDSKLKGPVNSALLVWIWDRLAQTGPHGKRYVARHKGSFMDCFPAPTAAGLPNSR
jgi:hypothetical protein